MGIQFNHPNALQLLKVIRLLDQHTIPVRFVKKRNKFADIQGKNIIPRQYQQILFDVLLFDGKLHIADGP
ncbi:hypothetical protein D3C75_1275000 [compost metagenome]